MALFRTIAIFLFALSLAHQTHAASAELRVRDTSFFIGRPFNFYIQVGGTRLAPQPELLDTDQLKIRYIGMIPASRANDNSVTFTYEAVPLVSGQSHHSGRLC